MNFVLNEELIEYTKNHKEPFVKSAHHMISQCLELDKEIPNDYRWLFSSKDSLEQQVKVITDGDSKKVNYIYWNDQASNIEAYCYMTFWRGVELIKSCVNGLNARDTIAPAIAARSLLELSTVFLLNANTLEKTFSKVTFPDKTVVCSTEVEELVVKMIWGTRYDNPEPHLQQTNIMTSLKKLAKNPNAKELMPKYEFLCDIAHPSFIGNTSYWSHVEGVTTDNREKRVISRLTSRNFNADILDNTIWSLAWSSVCIKNSFEMLMKANNSLLDKLSTSNLTP
ncbi:hypothetical protein [Photobacterium leiognathi]|uniref:hypothetical protein n=1 Tax=Photobacterium leiognathi TaxID=553611 RepID=UPI002736683A|nr:hypothetical protein [Photobacterium leiognathi]